MPGNWRRNRGLGGLKLSFKKERMQSIIKKEIGEFIIKELEKPALAHTTVTGVEISADLKQAFVYISTYGTSQEKAMAIKTLNKEAGSIRWEITRRIRARYIPQLRFEVDESIERGFKIDKLLNDIRKSN